MIHPKKKRGITVRDPIHRDIHLGEIQKLIVDTSLFQRLRRISQTGLLYLVYPGMRHSRFEHSLGSSHLAGKWFDELSSPRSAGATSLLKGNDREYDSDTKLLIPETAKLFTELETDENLRAEWRNIVTCAALLHDIGHGPFSHTLDELELISSKGFESLCSDPLILKFISGRISKKIEHEDISVVYCDSLFNQLASQNDFFKDTAHPKQRLVAALIHKDFRKFILAEDEHAPGSIISDKEMKLILIFSHLISGLFDVDRQDYLKRDSRMAGVKYGNIEHKRIHSGIVPVLTMEAGSLSSGLLAKADRVHMLDHFLVCLYEMYTQVYYHPTSAQIQHELIELVAKLKSTGRIDQSQFDAGWHQVASDSQLADQIDSLSNGILHKIVTRKYKAEGIKVVHQLYGDGELPGEISQDTWKFIDIKERPVIKDGSEVWLIEQPGSRIFTWTRASMVAGQLDGVKFIPKIWWKNQEFLEDLENIKNLTASQGVRQKSPA